MQIKRVSSSVIFKIDFSQLFKYSIVFLQEKSDNRWLSVCVCAYVCELWAAFVRHDSYPVGIVVCSCVYFVHLCITRHLVIVFCVVNPFNFKFYRG